MPTTKCDASGNCFYVYEDAWHVWGRWLFLALLIVFLIVLIPFSGYLMSIWRMRRGGSPVNGCAWMFPNPFKMDAEGQLSQQGHQQEQKPQRYRPHNAFIRYHQEQLQRDLTQREQYRTNLQGKDYTNDFSLTENDTVNSLNPEKLGRK